MKLRGRTVLMSGQPSMAADRFIGTKPVPTVQDDEYDNRYHLTDHISESEDGRENDDD